MRFVKQKELFPVENHTSKIMATSSTTGEEHARKRHGDLFNDDVRALIAGPSGAGKTNLAISLIVNPNGLCFENIYIYSKSLNQPMYMYLDKILSDLPFIGYHKFVDDSEEIISPGDAKPNSIFIFDDVQCTPQSPIREYFSMGRHRLIDTLYLCQTYSRVSKQLVRDNSNLIVLFEQDDLNLKHVFNDHLVSNDMTFDVFKEMCWLCWKEKFNFLLVDKCADVKSGRRYRKGLDTFIYL